MEIIPLSHPDNEVPLGSTCEFKLVRSGPRVETRCFLKHQGILYPKPLRDWSSADTVRIFPEAPGAYSLKVQWRKGGEPRGWSEHHFRVVIESSDTNAPVLTSDEPMPMWVPSDWEGQILRSHERPVLEAIAGFVKPGSVAYDIGANVGLYSLYLSRWVGPQGHVYCFEANPLCVYFLRANLQLNHAANCEVLPSAVMEHKQSIRFTINYGNSNLGVTQPSSFYASKVGHDILVDACSLDELSRTYQLEAPNLVKIDVEGAEEFVVKGMTETLHDHHPVIVVELHGRVPAATTISALESAGYRFRVVPGDGQLMDAGGILDSMPEAVVQVICMST